MIHADKNECTIEGEPQIVLTELTVILSCLFNTFADELQATRLFYLSIDQAREIYRQGIYTKLDKEIINKLKETEGE